MHKNRKPKAETRSGYSGYDLEPEPTSFIPSPFKINKWPPVNSEPTPAELESNPPVEPEPVKRKWWSFK